MEINYQERLYNLNRELLNTVIQIQNAKGNDSTSMRTMKMHCVNAVLEYLDLGWGYLLRQFKTHTPVHPEIAKELVKNNDDELQCILSQIFVRNEKLVRIVKNMAQQGLNVNQILAVDGLSGNITNGPNFEYKHYIGNLRFAKKGEPKCSFDEESDFKRLHVQTVREMYEMMQDTPVPSKHIYNILRKCFHQTVGINLPEIEIDEDESIDDELEGKIAIMYMNTMGREKITSFVKCLRFKGDKRPAVEMEKGEENEPRKKR